MTVHTPYDIETSNRYRIPVSAGFALGATITRPRSSGTFPALVWYDPYRSGADGRTTPMAEYFGRHGYAFVYLNVRGSGNSEGFNRDEYQSEETQDGCDAIAWLAAQPWCSGSVGMLGASYSGFNTLQVAAQAPPALKAIAPAYFTDRRYTDDCHYKGGCLRGYYDMLTYGLGMVARIGLPPHPEAVGEKWAELWQQRLCENEPYLQKWLENQVENDYWATGSIAGHYHQIKAASLLIGGWHDGYPTPPLRVFEKLRAPKKLLVGPWSHTYPNSSHCGPRIDIHRELLRWWDHWLKGADNGVDKEPAVQIYEQHFEEPLTDRTHIAGGWRMANALPDGPAQILYINGDALQGDTPAQQHSASVPYLPAACRSGGLWDAGVAFTLPGEQRADSALAINSSNQPLTEDLCILGNPSFSLFISADVEVVPVAARLLDIAPDGTAVLVTKGLINATRRNGMEQPLALVPGEISNVTFHMEATAWRFAKGHRIGLSVNGSDFPNVWPTPQAGHLTLHWGPEHPSHIALPVWDGGNDPAFEFQPSPDPPRATGSGQAPWQVVHDVLEDRYRLVLDGLGEMVVSQRDPACAWVNAHRAATVEWPGLDVRSEASGSLVSDEHTFTLQLSLNVYANDQLHFHKSWSYSTPRNLL